MPPKKGDEGQPSSVSRSKSMSGLPPASNTRSKFDNLAAGLPALGRSRSHASKKSGASGTEEQSQVPDPVVSAAGASTLPQNFSHKQLQCVHEVCATENQPLKQGLDRIQADLDQLASKQPALNDNSGAVEQLCRDQQKILGDIRDALQSINGPDGLVNQVALLRRDANGLREDASTLRVSAAAENAAKPMDIESLANAYRSEIAQLQNAARDNPAANMRENDDRLDATNRRSRRSRRAEESPDSSDSDDVSLEEDDEDSDEEDVISFFNRQKGPKHKDLKVLKPFDPAYERLMNYRFYRLLKRDRRRDASVMLDANKRTKALTLALGSKFHFSGEDPILVFSFLTRLVEEADLNGLSEAQLYTALPRFLTGVADRHFSSSRSSQRRGGASCWPEAVQHLLGTYATASAIREATQQVNTLRQHTGEDELAYSARLSTAMFRCGNVFSESQKMTTFVNGLIPEIQSLVARTCEGPYRETLRYDSLVQNARAEGLAYRARQGKAVPAKQGKTPLQYMGNSPPLAAVAERPSCNTGEQLLLLDGNAEPRADAPSSVATSDLPTTGELEGDSEALFAFNFRQAPQNPGTKRENNSGVEPCWTCYSPNHISPDCDLGLNEWQKVIDNFNALPPDAQRNVPRMPLRFARHFLKAEGATPPAHTEANPASKN